jgi:hypothetical protein
MCPAFSSSTALYDSIAPTNAKNSPIETSARWMENHESRIAPSNSRFDGGASRGALAYRATYAPAGTRIAHAMHAHHPCAVNFVPSASARSSHFELASSAAWSAGDSGGAGGGYDGRDDGA